MQVGHYSATRTRTRLHRKRAAIIAREIEKRQSNPYRDWKQNHVSASAPYVLAALIRATPCDGNWCGTVDANGTGSSSEAEILSYLWIFRPCQRLGKLFFLLKYLYQLYAGTNTRIFCSHSNKYRCLWGSFFPVRYT